MSLPPTRLPANGPTIFNLILRASWSIAAATSVLNLLFITRRPGPPPMASTMSSFLAPSPFHPATDLRASLSSREKISFAKVSSQSGSLCARRPPAQPRTPSENTRKPPPTFSTEPRCKDCQWLAVLISESYALGGDYSDCRDRGGGRDWLAQGDSFKPRKPCASSRA